MTNVHCKLFTAVDSHCVTFSAASQTVDCTIDDRIDLQYR